MIFDAIERVAVQSNDGTLTIGRQAMRDALFATSRHQGVTGELTCDIFGDCAAERVVIRQVQGGEFVTVWPTVTP